MTASSWTPPDVVQRRHKLLPKAAPQVMPKQVLNQGTLKGKRFPSTPPAMGWRRATVIGSAALLTLAAAAQIFFLLGKDGIDVLEAVLLLLFIALFAWIVQTFVATLAGFLVIMLKRPARLGLDSTTPLPALHARTALLMPTYNEDPDRILAGLQAICESVIDTGRAQHFDFFVLSDTRQPQLQAQEAQGVEVLAQRLQGKVNIFYRLRENNSERKAGNIADWVKRWGGDYPHFLILDADSLMTGDTIVRLAGAMERNPDVALVQTLPVIVNGNTLFARMQQFAGRVYGPVIAYGVAWWHGAESNYWGHNAMIRTRAFAEHAGLPALRGYTPFGGHILSHDFVEAALMRRGGWALHMEPSLLGSYEEGPPTLTDMLVRDRRWCQGNLQHGGVLTARGLHWVNRWHMLIGIGHYLTSPMWAMLMLVGMAIPLLHASNASTQVMLSDVSISKFWVEQGSDRFLVLFFITMAMLLAPKLFGYIATMARPAMRKGCGGVIGTLLGILLETILAALMAPVTMYVQCRGVAEVLAGRDSGWDSQRRDDGSIPFSSYLKDYGGITVFGAFIGVLAYFISPSLAAWMSPVILGWILSIPIVMFTSARAPGQWLKRLRIFSTPEELFPPQVITRALELRTHRITAQSTSAETPYVVRHD